MEAIIFKNFPFVANGSKCLIKVVEFTTLRNIHIEVCVNRRVGQITNVNSEYWTKYPRDSRDCDMYYCNVDSSMFHKFSDGHTIVEFVRDTFHPVVSVNLLKGDKASKEIFIIYC